MANSGPQSFLSKGIIDDPPPRPVLNLSFPPATLTFPGAWPITFWGMFARAAGDRSRRQPIPRRLSPEPKEVTAADTRPFRLVSHTEGMGRLGFGCRSRLKTQDLGRKRRPSNSCNFLHPAQSNVSKVDKRTLNGKPTTSSPATDSRSFRP